MTHACEPLRDEFSGSSFNEFPRRPPLAPPIAPASSSPPASPAFTHIAFVHSRCPPPPPSHISPLKQNSAPLCFPLHLPISQADSSCQRPRPLSLRGFPLHQRRTRFLLRFFLHFRSTSDVRWGHVNLTPSISEPDAPLTSLPAVLIGSDRAEDGFGGSLTAPTHCYDCRIWISSLFGTHCRWAQAVWHHVTRGTPRCRRLMSSGCTQVARDESIIYLMPYTRCLILAVYFALTRVVSDSSNRFRVHRRRCPHHFDAICHQEFECSSLRKQALRCRLPHDAFFESISPLTFFPIFTRGSVCAVPRGYPHRQQRV